jgi:hypothetical protein
VLSSDARNTTALAISSGLRSLPKGMLLEIIFLRSSPASPEASKSLAFVALKTLFDGNPLLATMEAFRMVEAPAVLY